MQTIFLQAAPAAGGSGAAWIQPLFLIGMVVIMYFFMLRPQAKKAKEQKAFEAGIDVNEQVITTAGIHGRISKISKEEGTIQLEVGRSTYLTLERSAISMPMTMAYRKRIAAANTPVVQTTTPSAS